MEKIDIEKLVQSVVSNTSLMDETIKIVEKSIDDDSEDIELKILIESLKNPILMKEIDKIVSEIIDNENNL